MLELNEKDDAFVDTLVHEIPDRHDDIQIENFIIQQNAHKSLWGTLRQCAMELRARRDALHNARAEYLLALHDLNAPRSLVARLVGLFSSPRRKLEKRLEREALYRKTATLQARILNLRYEIALMLSIARRARARAGDLRDPVHVRDMQVEYWANRIQGQLDSCAQPNGISGGLYDVIQNLPSDVRDRMGLAGAKLPMISESHESDYP